MEIPARRHPVDRGAASDVEWWTIERRPLRGGRTRYGIRVGRESVAAGHRSLFDAINAALAVLDACEAAQPGDWTTSY